MSNLARVPLPYLNIPFNSTFQASVKEYEGCYIGTKSPLQRPTWLLLSRQDPSYLPGPVAYTAVQQEQLWVIPSGTALYPVEEYGGPAVSLGLTLQQSGSSASEAWRL